MGTRAIIANDADVVIVSLSRPTEEENVLINRHQLDVSTDEGPRSTLEDLLWQLEDRGFSQWRLAREMDRYVLSVRPHAGRGVRWTRAAGRVPNEAAERLIRRHDIVNARPPTLEPASTGMYHPDVSP